MRTMERRILLQNVDQKWMDHIDNMEELRQGIYLRSYAQHNPVVEYRIEGFEMFDAMVASIREDTVRMLLTMQVRFAPKSQAVQLDPNDNVAAAETPTAPRPVRPKRAASRSPRCSRRCSPVPPRA